MHENGHNQGAVQPGAPHATPGGHCWDENDVMCYADGTRTDQPIENRCAETSFDCGCDSPAADGNDYFDSAPEPGEYLSTHWNIGSRQSLHRPSVTGWRSAARAGLCLRGPPAMAPGPSASAPPVRLACRSKTRARRKLSGGRHRAHGRRLCRAGLSSRSPSARLHPRSRRRAGR